MTLYPINPTGVIATDHAALQAAIDAAVDGDTILLREKNVGGTHTPWMLCPSTQENFGATQSGGQTVFTLNPRGRTPLAVYVGDWRAGDYGVTPLFTLMSSPADYSIVGDTLTFTSPISKGRTVKVVYETGVSLYGADVFDQEVIMPRNGDGGSNLLSLTKTFREAQANRDSRRPSYLEYKQVDVQKALIFRGEADGDGNPLTEVVFPDQSGTTKPLVWAGGQTPTSSYRPLAHCLSPAGFLIHNSKSCEFENLLFKNGHQVVHSFGAPQTVKHCDFEDGISSIVALIDNSLAYPRFDDALNPYIVVNRLSATNCRFTGCTTVGVHVRGGSIHVKDCLFNLLVDNPLYCAGTTGNLAMPMRFGPGVFHLAIDFFKGYPDLWHSCIPSRIYGDKIEKNIFGGTGDVLGLPSFGQCFIGTDIDCIAEEISISKNQFRNNGGLNGDWYGNGVYLSAPVWVYSDWWSSGWYDEERMGNTNSKIRKVTITKNDFVNDYGVLLMSALGSEGEVTDTLLSKNTITDCFAVLQYEPWGGADWGYLPSYVFIDPQGWNAVPPSGWNWNSYIQNCWFTGNDWTNSGWLEGEMLYFVADQTPDSGGANHLTGREFDLPGGVETLYTFISPELTFYDAPWYNDFSTDRKQWNIISKGTRPHIAILPPRKVPVVDEVE